MSFVYRVEHVDSKIPYNGIKFFRGPFTSGFKGVIPRHLVSGPPTGWIRGSAVYDSHKEYGHESNYHPSPWEDGLKYNEDSIDGMVCAFKDLEQLKVWFPCSIGRRALRQVGFVVRKYSVDGRRVRKLGKQCLVPIDVLTFNPPWEVLDPVSLEKINSNMERAWADLEAWRKLNPKENEDE